MKTVLAARCEPGGARTLAKSFGDAKGGDLYALNGFAGFERPLLNNGVFVCGRREQARSSDPSTTNTATAAGTGPPSR